METQQGPDWVKGGEGRILKEQQSFKRAMSIGPTIPDTDLLPGTYSTVWVPASVDSTLTLAFSVECGGDVWFHPDCICKCNLFQFWLTVL